MSSREEFIQNLREFASFLEKHPDVPTPGGYGGIHFRAEVETVAELRAAFHISGPWEKEYQGDTALYKKFFGEQLPNSWDYGNQIKYTLSLPREQVCVKRKVGTKYVPPYTPQPYTQEGHYEDVYEWDCI